MDIYRAIKGIENCRHYPLGVIASVMLALLRLIRVITIRAHTE